MITLLIVGVTSPSSSSSSSSSSASATTSHLAREAVEVAAALQQHLQTSEQAEAVERADSRPEMASTAVAMAEVVAYLDRRPPLVHSALTALMASTASHRASHRAKEAAEVAAERRPLRAPTVAAALQQHSTGPSWTVSSTFSEIFSP